MSILGFPRHFGQKYVKLTWIKHYFTWILYFFNEIHSTMMQETDRTKKYTLWQKVNTFAADD